MEKGMCLYFSSFTNGIACIITCVL